MYQSIPHKFQALDIYVDIIRRMAAADTLLQRQILQTLLNVQTDFWQFFDDKKASDATRFMRLERLIDQFMNRYLQKLNSLSFHIGHLARIEDLEAEKLDQMIQFSVDDHTKLTHLLTEYRHTTSSHHDTALQYHVSLKDFFQEVRNEEDRMLHALREIFFNLIDKMLRFYCAANYMQHLFKDLINHKPQTTQADFLLQPQALRLSIEARVRQDLKSYLHQPAQFL